jgi:hypothetical protein
MLTREAYTTVVLQGFSPARVQAYVSGVALPLQANDRAFRIRTEVGITYTMANGGAQTKVTLLPGEVTCVGDRNSGMTHLTFDADGHIEVM